MSKDAINYFEESEKYRPKKVRTLLIGEAPPPIGTKYFYVPKPMSITKPVQKDTSLPATIFYHYFKKRPETEEEYLDCLNRLRDLGIFLMDIVDERIKIRERGGINHENLQYLIGKIKELRGRIVGRGILIDEKDITFLLPRLHYKKQLEEEFPKSRKISWIDFRLSSD